MSATTLNFILCMIVVLAGLGCTQQHNDFTAKWIAEMDARPVAKQVPHWPRIRELMLRPAPAVGTTAPDFALQTRDSDETVRLSDRVGHRPVVLIFGSWT